MAELKKLNDTSDPFGLAEVIEEKLDTIYQLIARRHSPIAIAQKQIPGTGAVAGQHFPEAL